MSKTDLFSPARYLTSPHLQTILASSQLRKLALGARAEQFDTTSNRHLFESSCGATLECWYQPNPAAKGLVIMIHGWEGSAQSLYMLDSGSYLWQQGYSIVRINLRDHGDTHHLNDELFHSARLNEVAEVVAKITHAWPHKNSYLVGFSLGANFSLRISTHANRYGIVLDRVIAVCPPINPSNTMDTLNDGAAIYEKYFVKKWKRSLIKKALLHSHYNYLDILKPMKSLDEMNDYFISTYTDYPSLKDYFKAYSLPSDLGQQVQLKTLIIAAEDDPVCPVADIQALTTSDMLSIELQPYGGHCGFIQSARLQSWVPQRIHKVLISS